MAEKNGNNNSSRSSNDISEMLRLLRESVENDRGSWTREADSNDLDVAAVDDEIKLSLEKVFEETSLDKSELDDEDEDVDFDDEDETESSWFTFGDDSEDESDTEDTEPDEDVTEEDPENDDPWCSDEESEKTDESAENDPIDAEPDEDVVEEDPENDDPWYSDEESEKVTNEKELEENFIEEIKEELDPDITEDTAEILSENISEDVSEDILINKYGELRQIDNSGWYIVTPESEEETSVENDEKISSIDDESIWYNADESENEATSDEEFYQDEEFDDDDEYDDDFAKEDFEDTITEKSPENDFAEKDVYIYDAASNGEEDYIYETKEKTEESSVDIDDDETAIDETDIGLLTTLGVSSDDAEAELAEKDDPTDSYAGDISYDYDGGEYVLENQRHEIIAGYKNEKRATLTRLVVCGAFALLLLVYELLSAFGVNMPGMLNKTEFPLSHIMISLQLLVICVLMSVKQLYVGITDLISRNATPHSISSAVVLANVLSSIVLSIASPEQYEIFNFIGAFSIVVAIAYEYLLLNSEEHVFGVFSTKKGQKYAFVLENDPSDVTRDGGISLCAYSTEFNKNYFFRMRKRSSDYKYLTWVIVGVFGVSLLTFLISLIFKTGIALAMKNGVMIVNLALPIGVFAAFSYPMFRAAVKALGNRGAFVGVSAVDEYSKTRFVTFGEEELFTSLKTTHLDLKPAGNNNVSDVLCKTSVLLSAIGGPMKRMVEMMQSDFIGSTVEIDEIFDDGISATAGEVKMLAGSAQFLIQHGIAVDEATDFKDVDENNEVLYVSIDGKLAARYYLKYKADPEFIKLVNALGSRGISVGIRTRNPGINSDIIARRCPELKYKVYTIKTPAKDEGEQNFVRNTTDSGIVAAGKASGLAYPLLACCDLKKYYKVDMIMRIVSAVLGAAAVIANAIMAGSADMGIISALLYQCVWMIPSFLFGILHFKHRSKKKKFKIVYR